MISTFGGPLSLRRFAAVLVALEAIAQVGIGVWMGATAVSDEYADGSAVFVVATIVAAGAVLGWAAVALWRGKTWPRGFVITWQVLQCAAGFTVLAWSPMIGSAVIVVGVLSGVALIADVRRDGLDGGADVGEPAPSEG